ncbi:MAG: superoxide dismutase [Patescibacteria group bacterium]
MNALPLSFTNLNGISEKTLAIHHDKLYAGYVAKTNEIQDKLGKLTTEQLAGANQSFSDLRALKDGEIFATNGVYLHEWYFDTLGGDGKPSGTIVDALATQFGSLEAFQTLFTACGMSARGWVVLCWDTHEQALRIYNADAHNQGGVWGCVPILVLDVYEHAYFMDAGSDRKAYITAWWQNLDWTKIEQRFIKK